MPTARPSGDGLGVVAIGLGTFTVFRETLPAEGSSAETGVADTVDGLIDLV